MNNYTIASIICMLLGVALAVLTYVLLNKLLYPETTQDACAKNHIPAKDGDECSIWDSNACRRGTYSGGVCTSKSSKLPLITAISAFVLIISWLVLFYIGHKKK